MKKFKITYLHHSGFICELENAILVFDYYMDTEGKLDRLLKTSNKPLYFFVSHFHADHFNPEISRYEEKAAGYFLHSDCTLPVKNTVRLHYLEPGEFTSVNEFQVKMYGSTDAGGSFWITHPNVTIFHAGDLNWWHWAGESDADNLMARDEYFKELGKLSGKQVDIAFFPVDARQAVAREWGVKAFLETVTVKTLLVPMHAFGHRWAPSYEFRWRFPDTPLWIPEKEGDIFEGEVK